MTSRIVTVTTEQKMTMERCFQDSIRFHATTIAEVPTVPTVPNTSQEHLRLSSLIGFHGPAAARD